MGATDAIMAIDKRAVARSDSTGEGSNGLAAARHRVGALRAGSTYIMQ